jgi:transposase
VLANPAHIRKVPGRKSDLQDASWIAELLAHGLIRASLVPPEPIQELDLTRTRKQLMREVVQHKQRIHKVLEDATKIGLGGVGRARREWPTDVKGPHRGQERRQQVGGLGQ